MRKEILTKVESSFFAYEKDVEIVLQRLFLTSSKFANDLKKLLIINKKDALSSDNNEIYQSIIDEYNVKKLVEEGYITYTPRVKMFEHEEVKSMISISMENFRPNLTNPQFRDFTLVINIVSNTDVWEMDNYALRPVKIMGIIDGLLNNQKFTGIGVLNFSSADPIFLDQDWNGFVLRYEAIHGSDDRIPPEE